MNAPTTNLKNQDTPELHNDWKKPGAYHSSNICILLTMLLLPLHLPQPN
jgi:hypothetical protein